MSSPIRKKLIEIALPLEAINRESAREKSIRHGHPSTLHLWWARRPLAACRAVLFASLVDDPSSCPEQFPTEEAQERERQRLFRIIEELVKWENSGNELVLEQARSEIRRSCNGNPPPVLDPFCGGGSIPLEAQRLGLETHASDLNPVAVLITKALIEIPPRFANRPPVHPTKDKRLTEAEWHGARGLAEDIRYYGQWMRDEAERRIGHLYPKVKLPLEQGGGEATVIAWLWARTVACANPACGAQMPLVRSFWLSTKKGKKAWVEPRVDKQAKKVQFEVRTGEGMPQNPPKIGRGAKFRCLVCEQLANDQHIKDQGMTGRMGAQLMAIVAEGNNRRVYLPPNDEHIAVSLEAKPDWAPEEELPHEPRAIWCTLYGLKTYRDLFTLRQLTALTTFSDLISEARKRVLADAIASGLTNDGEPLNMGGMGATAYADSVATFLTFGVSKLTDNASALCSWHSGAEHQKIRATFGRQALPMVWDFAEGNVFSDPTGNFFRQLTLIAEVLERGAISSGERRGKAIQLDATSAINGLKRPLTSTDPPYYDNIGYADLSDFFYVWLRRSLGKIFPNLFSTLLVPKAQELVATPYRFGGDAQKAKAFFEEGLCKAFAHMHEVQHPNYPHTVFYAFKEAETDEEDGNSSQPTASTGWETMLEGLLTAGFTINGTWPVRSELSNRTVASGTNALASSIVLACRPRPENAPLATRREFIAALKRELPDALKKLQHGNIAPVDLAQAAIGPGMAVFSRYAKVLEADGTPMRVRTALALINQGLDEVLTEQEGEFDADTRWAVAWFEQSGFDEGLFGTAETLSKAKNTAVRGMVEAGILAARTGKVRLLCRDELPEDWDPTTDRRIAVWEVTQHLIRALEQQGETGAAALVQKVGGLGEVARDLAYRLYGICERKKWAQEALAYNSLVIAWPEIVRLAGQSPSEVQEDLF